MLQGRLSSQRRGCVAEMMVCAWALEQGYDVYQPVPGLTPPADLLYDNGWAMTRVQVKRAHERKRGNSRQLRVNLTNGNDNVYEQGGLDCFAVVDVPTGRI